MTIPTDIYNINTVIVKNNSLIENIMIEDLGIEILTNSELILSNQFSPTEIVESKDLKDLILLEKLIVNNGTIDLNIETAFDYLTINTLSGDLDPNNPIFNSNKFYNQDISNSIPEDGDVFVYNASQSKYILLNKSEPIWDANKLCNFDLDCTDTPSNGDSWIWDAGTNKFKLIYTKPPNDSVVQVFTLLWAETQTGKTDWIKFAVDDLPELGHILPFPIKLRDAGIFCQTTTGPGYIELYINNNFQYNLFTISGTNQTNFGMYRNDLNLIVNPLDRIRLRTSNSNNLLLKKYVIVISAERIG